MLDPNFVEVYDGLRFKCSHCGEFIVVALLSDNILEVYCEQCSDKVNQLDDIDSYASDVDDAMESLSDAVSALRSAID